MLDCVLWESYTTGEFRCCGGSSGGINQGPVLLTSLVRLKRGRNALALSEANVGEPTRDGSSLIIGTALKEGKFFPLRLSVDDGCDFPLVKRVVGKRCVTGILSTANSPIIVLVKR